MSEDPDSLAMDIKVLGKVIGIAQGGWDYVDEACYAFNDVMLNQLGKAFCRAESEGPYQALTVNFESGGVQVTLTAEDGGEEQTVDIEAPDWSVFNNPVLPTQ
jgi:hypothetical protein